MKFFIDTIKNIRRNFMLMVKPRVGYFLATKTVHPLSTKYGFDRGTPIDRYYIEKFLAQNKKFIRGVCLEITDDAYTRRFGGNRVTRCDVLDINTKNIHANIHGDLRNLRGVRSNAYDCIILTQVLGMIDDIQAVTRECHRILKPGGTLLLTCSGLNPVFDQGQSYWRFTISSIQYLFRMQFRPKDYHVVSFGNVLTGQCFWVGMAHEELTHEELTFNDPRYPVVVAGVATKQGSSL